MLQEDQRPVLFFDVDDCLYSKDVGIDKMMYDLTEQYMIKHVQMEASEAAELHEQYIKTYGSTIKGLMLKHGVDAVHFNKHVDGALPLEEMLCSDLHLQKVLSRFDRKKVKLWLLTNAYKTHATRVINILGIESFFEGCTFADYACKEYSNFITKPDAAVWKKAEEESGVNMTNSSQPYQCCWFVDNSATNCYSAGKRGWNVFHLLEDGPADTPDSFGSEGSQVLKIRTLDELLEHLPQFVIVEEQKGGET